MQKNSEPSVSSEEPSSEMSPTSHQTSGPAPSVSVKFVSAGLAACIAEIGTLPLDTAKVRLQIQGEVPGSASAVLQSAGGHGGRGGVLSGVRAGESPFKYRGVLRTVYVISAEEGVPALYNGLVAGLQRQLFFASIRIGFYDTVKHFYFSRFYGNESAAGAGGNVLLRIMAGITTGALAVSVAQPTDVVKVRMQAQTRHRPGTVAASVPHHANAGTAVHSVRYRGCLHAYRTIAREEGVRGLWKGVLPNITRNAIVNAAELVSYDLIKEAILKRRLMSDNWPCHFVSAFGAGFCTTCVASPVDVVKTRYMNSASGVYRGAFHCALVMYRERGLFTFYKGFAPAFMRLGSWNIAMFVSFEQLKRLINRASM